MVIDDQRPAGRSALGEVADVTDGVEEVRSLAFVNGTPAVALDVLKQTGANAVGVADAIKAEAAAIQAELPAGTTIDIVRDGSIFIRESVADVQETLDPRAACSRSSSSSSSSIRGGPRSSRG